jgi:hypothetical protein
MGILTCGLLTAEVLVAVGVAVCIIACLEVPQLETTIDTWANAHYSFNQIAYGLPTTNRY